ncbi:hypothetical protein D6829_00340 [Candidatus Pacearchaeota archaeon]|nr:MAG: hypothetical protein D6829_00340 [Candidatus Pacearchaeota archaeon]
MVSMRWLIVLVLLVPLAFAEPNMSIENSAQPGETILGKITTTNLVEKITKDNFAFFSGRRKVPFEIEIKELNKTYYFYIVPTISGNFTMKVSHIVFKENETIKEKNFEEVLEIRKKIINESNTSGSKILSVLPGFIEKGRDLHIENKGDFELELEVLGEKIKLKKGESKIINFEEIKDKKFVEVKSYKKFVIPVIVSETINESQEKPIGKSFVLRFEGFLTAKVSAGKNETVQIKIRNIGSSVNITSIQSPPQIIFPRLERIKGNSTVEINLTLRFKRAKFFNSTIFINYTEGKKKGILEIPTEIFVVEKGVNKTKVRISDKTCEELNGKECSRGFFCNGTAEYTIDKKYCCFAQCVKLNEPHGSSSWIIGLLIIIVLAFVAYLAYKKQKKLKKLPEEKLESVKPYSS